MAKEEVSVREFQLDKTGEKLRLIRKKSMKKVDAETGVLQWLGIHKVKLRAANETTQVHGSFCLVIYFCLFSTW